MTITHYDLIGDIHGQADKLINLLQKLGYQQQTGVYQQAQHQVIFVGDLIDRGGQEKQVLTIVQAMIKAGHAQAVMGNHEFNAICYHTRDKQGKFLRSQNTNHTQQHQHFLNEYPYNSVETNEMINWFKTLPLFLEFDGFRVVHACWDENLIEQIKPLLDKNNCLKPEQYLLSCQKDSFFYHAIEILLKGPELTLPNEGIFTDKVGTARHKVRVKWWMKKLLTYQQAAVGSKQSRKKLATTPLLKNNIPLYPADAVPVFFGHYWFLGVPKIASDNAICLDYSAATTGALVGYCLNNSKIMPLNNQNFYQSEV